MHESMSRVFLILWRLAVAHSLGAPQLRETVRMILTSVGTVSPFSTIVLIDGAILCALAAELRLFQSVAALQRQG
jgi:hypothetical protein